MLGRAGMTTVVIGMLLIGLPSTAQAVPAGTIGSFPTWSVGPGTDSTTRFQGTGTFGAATGIPQLTVTTDSTTARAPSGESAFLGASTGFGQYFGSSRSQPYLYLSPGSGAFSTTTVTFTSAPPAGWGFAVGDIDADWVQITPLDAAGLELPVSSLNAQDTDNTPFLNSCRNSPKPSSCTGSGPYDSFPYWLEGGGSIPGGTAVYPPGSVVGQGSDTSGAYDWFLPAAGVQGLRLTFSVQSGFPIYQFWVAAPAPVAQISGQVVIPDASADQVSIALENPDGTPVLGLDDTPVVVPVAPDGGFVTETEVGRYQLEVIVPPGFVAPAPIPVDATTGGVDLADIVVAPIVSPSPSPSPLPTPTPTTGVLPAAEDTPGELPPTGPATPWLPALGTVLLVIGAGAVAASGSMRRRTQ